MSQELGPYQKNVQLRAPNAKQKLDDFIAAKMAHVKQIVDVSDPETHI